MATSPRKVRHVKGEDYVDLEGLEENSDVARRCQEVEAGAEEKVGMVEGAVVCPPSSPRGLSNEGAEGSHESV